MGGLPTPKWAATPSRKRRNAVLEVLKEQQRVASVQIGQQACYLLGRNADVCDVAMQHPSISRQHAVVAHTDQGDVVVMDLESAQGTFVNGQELEANKPMVLKNDDCITFGASTRTYVVKQLETEEKQVEVEAVESSGDAWNALPTSFGGGKQGQQSVKETPGEVNKEHARKKREEEIARMTASFMAPLPVSKQQEATKTPDDDKNKEDESHHIQAANDDNEEEDGEDEGEYAAKDDVAARYNIPIAKEVHMKGHHKAIACIAVDTAGARVATGSLDYHVKLWDFAGMARQVKPFRDVEPEDGHALVALSYSPSSDRLLVATASSQPKILSREGIEELHFAKGDMYVVEMANTQGHTHSVTGGMWHPSKRAQVLTSSLDGTMRLWDLNGKQVFGKLVNAAVLKPKSKKAKRCAVTTCRYNLDGSLVACGTMDGQVQCWDPRRAYAGPAISIRNAHAEGGGDLGISSIRFAPNHEHICATRACSDDTVKLWDVRKPQHALKTFRNLEGVFGTCNVAFNAAGTCLAVGTCVRRGRQQAGVVHFLDVFTPGIETPLTSLNLEIDESAVCVEWHAGINQVLVGSSSSSCRVLYDPQSSQRGALLTAALARASTAPRMVESGVRLESMGKVYNPHALPMYRDEMSKKRKFERLRGDAKATKAPEKPLTGPGMGGKVSGSSTFTQYFMSTHIKSSFREEDPREAILKYAKKAKEDAQFVGPAYARSQPVGKMDARYDLATQTLEEEQQEAEEQERRLLQP